MPDPQSERAALVEKLERLAERLDMRSFALHADSEISILREAARLNREAAAALAASEADLQHQRAHFKGREVELGDRIDAALEKLEKAERVCEAAQTCIYWEQQASDFAEFNEKGIGALRAALTDWQASK